MPKKAKHKKRKRIYLKYSINTSTHKTRISRTGDKTLSWIPIQYPQLLVWHPIALDWINGQTTNLQGKINALNVFLIRYVVKRRLPINPSVLLNSTTILPEFYNTSCPNSSCGTTINNYVCDFINFVLLRNYSILDANGVRIINSDYHNPIKRRSHTGFIKHYESVRSPLPFGYIEQIREIIASGPNFSDWKWAQTVLGREIGKPGGVAPDWFPVNEAEIDREDPDCVYRVRKNSRRIRLEMWSPVRWVALLTKLILPLRGFQVRLLDSGESDTYRYEAGQWLKNTHKLAMGSERKPVEQGVFRRTMIPNGDKSISTILYINTNKSADIGKSGSDKGYTIPWPDEGALHNKIYYWLEKLRNWQEKYNPIKTRTSWRELDPTHIGVKSDPQLAGYSDSCFLFRFPEISKSSGIPKRFPISKYGMQQAWFRLLKHFENKLADLGEKNRNGSRIRLVPEQETNYNSKSRTYFPIHSTRVSLITSLAIEGQVPLPILQSIVGHSRLVMTLYYTKPGAKHIQDALVDANERLSTKKEKSIENFLLNTEHSQLLQQAICNSRSSIASIIPEHPAARNPAGWMYMDDGVCLAGGNTSDSEEVKNIDGCHNGGPNIGSPSKPVFSAVPGGSRNCIRCRWFITEYSFLPALVARFNNIAYRLDEARKIGRQRENELLALKKIKAEAEEANQPFTRFEAYRKAERVWEKAIKRFCDLFEDLMACHRHIMRCVEAKQSSNGNTTQLIAIGTAMDVNLAFETNASELLQLSGICENVEIYPDLEPDKAVYRRSQLLDAVLYRDDIKPLFILLSEHEQLLAGNAFMKRLANQMNPKNPMLGEREVIRLMDAGKRLSEYLDVDLSMLLPAKNEPLAQNPMSIDPTDNEQ